MQGQFRFLLRISYYWPKQNKNICSTSFMKYLHEVENISIH